MDWPPKTHADVAAQAYAAGGGKRYAPGLWYLGIDTVSGMGASGLSVNLLVATPFFVPVRQSFDRIGTRVFADVAGATLRFGIYDTVDGQPGSLLAETGSVDASTAGPKDEAISVTLDPGLYWLAMVNQDAALTVYSFSNAVQLNTGATAFPANVSNAGRHRTGISGSLPNPFGTMTSSTPTVMWLRAA